MSTKLEINFNRLLNRCEIIANDRESWDWRLEKYIEALQQQLGDVKRSTSKPAQDIIIEYSRRVDFLKGLLEAEQKQTTSERAIATERLAPVTTTSQKGSGIAPKEVHLHAKSRLQGDLRSELLGEDNNKQLDAGSNGVRQRKHDDSGIDAVLKHQRKVQEQLAEELLHHTLNLKDFAYASNSLVKRDIENIAETNKLADKNYTNLQTESKRLESKTKSCSWWIWIMLMLVTLTFLWMVVLMRMLPHKS